MAQGMPRNAENSDFYRFVARNPCLHHCSRQKMPKCGQNGAEQQDRTIRPPAGGRWREAPEGGCAAASPPPASLQPSQQGLYATNPRCMTSARVCTGSPSRSVSRFPDRRRGKSLRLSSQDHHLASPEARSASKPPLRSSRMSSIFSVPMDRRMVPWWMP